MPAGTPRAAHRRGPATRPPPACYRSRDARGTTDTRPGPRWEGGLPPGTPRPRSTACARDRLRRKAWRVNEAAVSRRVCLEQTADAPVRADVDAVRGRHPGEPGHGHDVAADHDHEFRARREPHLANVDHVVRRRAAQFRVGGEGVLGLGDAHRVVPIAAILQLADVRADRKSTRLNSSHTVISYAVFCLKKKTSTPASCPSCYSKGDSRTARWACASEIQLKTRVLRSWCLFRRLWCRQPSRKPTHASCSG